MLKLRPRQCGICHGDVLMSKLHDAAGYGHAKALKLLLDEGADINTRNTYGETPLHWAAEYGKTEIAKLLLDSDADVNAKDKDDGTPLHCATKRGYTEIVKLLLNGGADVNAKDEDGRIPLHWAAYNGHTEIVKLLLDKGADVNAQKKNGETSLHDAIYLGHIETVNLLLDRGADVNATTEKGETPLNIATAKRRDEVIAILTAHRSHLAEAEERDSVDANGGESPLMPEIRPRDEPREESPPSIVLEPSGSQVPHWTTPYAAKLLLDKDAPTVTPESEHTTAPTVEAAFLVEAADELDPARRERSRRRTRQGYVSLGVLDEELFDAACIGNTRAIKRLLAKGADVNGGASGGITPLHAAASNGHTKAVKLLLDRRADVNAKDEGGTTPLHLTALNCKTTAVFLLLLDRGADVYAKQRDGTTPLHLAALVGSPQIVKLILDRDANVYAKDEAGLTPLHYGASNGNTKVVELLLNKGAHIYAKDEAGRTPLHDATSNGHIKAVKLLLDSGADVYAKDEDGETPLSFATNKGHPDIVKLLLDNGLDVSVKQRDGETPLRLATAEDHRNHHIKAEEQSSDYQVPHWTTPSLPFDFESTDKNEISVARGLFDAEDSSDDEFFCPKNLSDARVRVIRSIVERRGQPEFRRKLIEAYGARCCVTGYSEKEVLEAAHIFPYLGEQTNHVTNGLLLRADIHTLFDIGLIAIDEDFKVLTSPNLDRTEYSALRGQAVSIPEDPAARPSVKALQWHREQTGL